MICSLSAMICLYTRHSDIRLFLYWCLSVAPSMFTINQQNNYSISLSLSYITPYIYPCTKFTHLSPNCFVKNEICYLLTQHELVKMSQTQNPCNYDSIEGYNLSVATNQEIDMVVFFYTWIFLFSLSVTWNIYCWLLNFLLYSKYPSLHLLVRHTLYLSK